MARDTKLTSGVYTAIIDAASLGVSKVSIAKMVGITETTLYNWLKWGENSEDPNDIYFEFFKDFRRAEGQVERNHLAAITKAASKGSWQASGWLLERKFPDQWGRKEKIEQKIEMTNKTVTAEELSDDELAAIASASS